MFLLFFLACMCIKKLGVQMFKILLLLTILLLSSESRMFRTTPMWQNGIGIIVELPALQPYCVSARRRMESREGEGSGAAEDSRPLGLIKAPLLTLTRRVEGRWYWSRVAFRPLSNGRRLFQPWLAQSDSKHANFYSFTVPNSFCFICCTRTCDTGSNRKKRLEFGPVVMSRKTLLSE